jgi:hypothetical protein
MKYLVGAVRVSWVGIVALFIACSSCGGSSGPGGKSTGGSSGTGGGMGATGGVLGSDGGVDSTGGRGGSGTGGTDGGGAESSGGFGGQVDASIAEAGGGVGGALDSSGVDLSAVGVVDAGVDAGEPDAPMLRGDDFVTDVKLTVHPQTSTILQVTWTQLQPSDTTWLEFSFADSAVMASRPQPGALGAHRDVVLGVPEKTVVAVRIVNRLSGATYKSAEYQGTTGALPSSFPRPQLLAYEPSLASPERFMLGAVDGSPGGCGDVFSCYYLGPFWIYIMDRQGRIVWYWADMSDNASSAYPRVARDGAYIVIDRGRGGKTGVVKMTLDRQYYQFTAIQDLDDALDVTSDGSVLYDTNGELFELTKQGTTRSIWSCAKYFGPSFACYSNTVNWVAADDSVLLSFPAPCVVVQVSRKNGTVLGLYGNVGGSYAFSPSPWRLEFPHSPTLTPDGTLLVSAHLPGYPDGTAAGPNHHAFEEFSIDRTARKLTQKWIYSDGPEWAAAKGFAIRLANGNTLVNYGTGGVIRELTPDQQTVFDVRFPAQDPNANPYFGRMVGNTVYVDDLYALNGGPVP